MDNTYNELNLPPIPDEVKRHWPIPAKNEWKAAEIDFGTIARNPVVLPEKRYFNRTPDTETITSIAPEDKVEKIWTFPNNTPT